MYNFLLVPSGGSGMCSNTSSPGENLRAFVLMSYARLLAALASSEFCEINWRACCRSNTLDAISDSEYVKCCSCDHGNVGCSM